MNEAQVRILLEAVAKELGPSGKLTDADVTRTVGILESVEAGSIPLDAPPADVARLPPWFSDARKQLDSQGEPITLAILAATVVCVYGLKRDREFLGKLMTATGTAVADVLKAGGKPLLEALAKWWS